MTGDYFVTLPVSRRLHVCRERNGDVEPLAELPGAPDSHAVVDEASKRVAILDSMGKRAGLFQLADEAPWIDRVLPFASLPKGCKGHVCMPLGEGLLVGGSSKTGEALWWRHPEQGSEGWQVVELPAQIRRPGKAIDGLHRDGDTLIAVDDIVTPKWLLLYQIGNGDVLTLQKSVMLPPHISYEWIFASSLGDSALWLVSRGVNHGVAGRYVWGVNRKTWEEVACWPACSANRQPRLRGPQYDAPVQAEPSPLLQARAVMEWQGRLLVACGDKGLVQIPLQRTGSTFARTNPEPVRCIRIHDVRAIQASPSNPEDGVFVTGINMQGELKFVWLSRENV